MRMTPLDRVLTGLAPLLGFAAVSTVLALLGSCTAAAAPVSLYRVVPPIIPPAQLLIVGDSITAGYVASDPSTLGYAALVAADLHVSATASIYGFPGADSSQVLADVPPAALAASHSYVVIQTGTNDFDDSTPAQFASAYSALVSAATATLAGQAERAQLVCLTAWQNPRQFNQYGQTVAAYNAIISADCHAPTQSDAQAHVVDITSLYTNPAYHNQSGDTFHPNDAGHSAIAQAIMAALS
jgi:acyl-CoA thioesterase I